LPEIFPISIRFALKTKAMGELPQCLPVGLSKENVVCGRKYGIQTYSGDEKFCTQPFSAVMASNGPK
jgi:hypothetical protein